MVAAEHGCSPAYAISDPSFMRLGAALADRYPNINHPDLPVHVLRQLRVSITYQTDESIIDRVLPPGLQPTDRPVVQADVMRIGHSNCVGGFDGGGLYVRAEHNSHEGDYCLALPMSTDAAITWGRELFGEPKKHATVAFDRNGDYIQAAFSRYDDRIIDIEAALEGSASIESERRSLFITNVCRT